MAVTEYTGSFGTYYAGGGLSKDQQKANVIYIGKYLLNKGWSLAAIAGLCGNIESECHFNPGTKEIGGSGYGLIQWTPGTIHKTWCQENGYTDFSTMDANLAHINDEAEKGTSWIKKGEYTESYSEFSKSFKSPYYLACVFAWNRERSGVVLWGFHRGEDYIKTPPHNNTYCKKTDYDSNCEANCKAWAYCYKTKYGASKYAAQQERNRQELRDTRGNQAENWYKVLWIELYARLDETDTSVLNSKYWISSLNNRGGLNYNTAIEDWSSAQKNWTAADQKNIKGTGTTLPNCTSWAWGRAYEIMGEAPLRFTGDAGNWWNCYTKEQLEEKGYSKSQTPTYGAIACWQDPNNPTEMGHVAIVENIHNDGTITISESGYTTWGWRPSYFNVQKRKAGATYKTSTNTYSFVGYIGLPKYGQVTAAAPSIESFKLDEVRTEEADFTISIKDNGSAISRVYYTLNGVVIDDLDISSGDSSFTITNLVPATDYSITISVEAGTTTVTSNQVSFTTKQDYPDPVKNISISSITDKNLETEIFKVIIEAPDNWGYWQSIGNDYGYQVYPIADSVLLENFDSQVTDLLCIKPIDLNIEHGKNFQFGISSWVTDNDGVRIFAEPGAEYPVGSNSVYLKDASEISDTCFLVVNDTIHRIQPYIKTQPLKVFKPLNIFKL